jgi:hypothetical protein
MDFDADVSDEYQMNSFVDDSRRDGCQRLSGVITVELIQRYVP